MDRKTALRKVLACLRLAKSSNPTESATALRQARALMVQYGLTEEDTAAAGITEAEAPTGFRGGMVPRSMLLLANLIAAGYRCKVVVSQGLRTTLRFFGTYADANVAAYAFTVLRRQLQKDKARHVSRIRKRANREARGEMFASGWVLAVAKHFDIAVLPPGHQQAIDAAIKLRCGDCGTTTGKEVAKAGRAREQDRYAGYAAGQQAQFNRGLTEDQRQLEAL